MDSELDATQYCETADEIALMLETDLEKSTVENLKTWMTESKLQQNKGDRLLKILKPVLPSLPSCSKTFLRTTRATYEVNRSTLKNQEFVYLGLKKGILQHINEDLYQNGDTVDIIMDFDGLSPYRGSIYEAWPGLAKIFHEDDIYTPFPVFIEYGIGKPSMDEEYWIWLVNEINDLQDNGIEINDKSLRVKLKFFVCDTLARALIKRTKGHVGFEACERCTVMGDRESGCTFFLDSDCPSRTDDMFRNLDNPGHHNEVSPFTRIKDLDMINQFVLDPMHLCYLVGMKKLLDIWLKGALSHLKGELCRRLQSIRESVPKEFQRKIRDITNVTKYKATELRFILLYIGPIVFKNLLPQNQYEHFLLFHSACRILTIKKFITKYAHVAKSYLQRFVDTWPLLYGSTSMAISVHNLRHVADDCIYHKCTLDQLSAFSFENYMGKMKRLL